MYQIKLVTFEDSPERNGSRRHCSHHPAALLLALIASKIISNATIPQYHIEAEPQQRSETGGCTNPLRVLRFPQVLTPWSAVDFLSIKWHRTAGRQGQQLAGLHGGTLPICCKRRRRNGKSMHYFLLWNLKIFYPKCLRKQKHMKKREHPSRNTPSLASIASQHLLGSKIHEQQTRGDAQCSAQRRTQLLPKERQQAQKKS